MFKKSFFLVLSVVLLSASAYCTAQVKALPLLEADSSMQSAPKPLLILLSTDWCKYCQIQKNQLTKNTDFMKRADQFYYAEFNAESKEAIQFNGNTYRFKPTGIATGIHELAIALSGGEQLAFPSWVLLNEKYQVLFRYQGLLSPQQIKELLNTLDKVNKQKI